MGTGEPSLSSSQPLPFSSSRWLWVKVSDLLCFYTCPTLLLLAFWFSLVKAKGVHGSGWGFFYPTHYGGSKKIQPNPIHHINPTQPAWVGLNPWVGQFFLLLLLLNLAEKNISHLPPELINKIYINI